MSPRVRRNLESVQIGSNQLEGVPDIQRQYFSEEGTAISGQLIGLERHPVLVAMKEAFDIDISGEMSPRDTSIYCAAIDQCDDPDFVNHLKSISPDRVNLRFDDFRDLRTDLISNLLGGGNHARWPNVKLAEAFSRIISGRKVKANLINDHDSTSPKFEPMPLTGLDSLRECLKGAVYTQDSKLYEDPFKGSTGHELELGLKLWNSELLPTGKRIECYAKTGTMGRGIPGRKETATFIFCLAIETLNGDRLKSVTGVVYFHDRGGAGSIAVPLAANLLAPLKEFYFNEFFQQ